KIVVNTDSSHKKGKYYQPHELPLLHNGEQHIILRHKTTGERNTCQREKEYCGCKSKQWFLFRKAIETIISIIFQFYQHGKYTDSSYAISYGINNDTLPG